MSSVTIHWSDITAVQTSATFSSFLNVSGMPLHSSSTNSWLFLAQLYQLYMTDIHINHTEAYDSSHCWPLPFIKESDVHLLLKQRCCDMHRQHTSVQWPIAPQ
jgi:hypothetical protein